MIKREELQKIVKAAELVNSDLKLAEVLKNIVKVAIELTNADRGTFYIVDEDHGEIWSLIATGMATKEIRLKIGEGIAGFVAQTGEILNINDAREDERFQHSFDDQSGYVTRNMLCHPIRNAEKEIVGVLQLLNKNHGPFLPRDEDLISTLSINCAVALNNALLHQKQLEFNRQLEINRREAEKLALLKTHFLTQMSHEIRTPLNIILSGVEYLKLNSDPVEPEQTKEVYEMLEKGSQRIVRTVDNVLALSKIKVGDYEIRPETFELEKDIILPVIRLFEAEAEQKEIQLIYQNATSPRTLTKDKFMVHQIFTELIDNALKFTSKGEVRVTQYLNEKQILCVSVIDTGVGMSEEFIKNLFEPFSQEEVGPTRKYEGNGLSLALIKKYCDLNEMSIHVTSKKNAGTRFTVSF